MKMATGRLGSTLLIAAALLGIAVSVVNYVMPDNGIAGTPGALLVIAIATAGAFLRSCRRASRACFTC